MGWLSGWNSKKELVEHLRRKSRFDDTVSVVKSTMVGNNHWYVIRNNETKVDTIYLDVVAGDFGSKRNPEWGYTSMSESAGPIHCNCPLAYLNYAKAPNEFAENWRVRVKTYHDNVSQKKSLAKGSVVTFQFVEYEILSRLGRKGWQVKSLADQTIYKMSNIQMNRAAIQA